MMDIITFYRLLSLNYYFCAVIQFKQETFPQDTFEQQPKCVMLHTLSMRFDARLTADADRSQVFV